MKTSIKGLKKFVVTFIGLPVIAGALAGSPSVTTNAAVQDFDAAAVYRAKCVMCHGAKSEKKFDASKSEEEHVSAILKGRDGTPKMPEYESKGINADQAKALVAYMKSLKQ